MAAAVLLALSLFGGRPFADERHLLDRRLEALRRVLPDAPFPDQDAALVRELGRQSALPELDAAARAPLETGPEGEVPVQVSGSGRFTEIERFFRLIALSPRLVDVETLRLDVDSGSRVRFAAVLRLPYRPQRAALPAAPEGLPPVPSGLPRAQAAAFYRDQALALAKAEAISVWRRRQRNPRLFFSELAAVAQGRPVVFTRARLGPEEFRIEGATVGEAAMRALQARFERGFFRVADVSIVQRSGCHHFEVSGRTPVVGIEAELPLPAADPFGLADEGCRVDRDDGRGLRLRHRAPAPGPLTVRLRAVDLADAFHVLHVATGEDFVVDGDVRGLVTLDLEQADLASALAALQRAGVTVSADGPLRRVSRNGGAADAPVAAAAAAAGDDAGEAPADPVPETARARYAGKRVALSELLSALGGGEAGLEERAGSGRLSVWAAKQPPALLQSAARRAARQDTVPPPAESSRRLAVGPGELSVSEFRVAALARGIGPWTAFAYGPTGTLHAYHAGDRLADGAIVAVEATFVVLETEDGPLRIDLPEP